MAELKIEEKIAVFIAVVVVIGAFVLAGTLFGLEGVLGGAEAPSDTADSLASPQDLEDAFGDASGSFEY